MEPDLFGEGLEVVILFIPAPNVCGVIAVFLTERFRRQVC